DELDPKAWHAPGVPFFFKRKDAEEQVEIALKAVGAIFARGPNLRRDELHESGLPTVKPVLPRANVSPHCLSEAQVEKIVIDADNHVRLAGDRQAQQFVELPAALEI